MNNGPVKAHPKFPLTAVPAFSVEESPVTVLAVGVEEIIYQGATIPSYVVIEKSGSVDPSRYVATLTHTFLS